MGEYALAAEVRTQRKKGAARKLRAAGRIPAVLYGRGNPATSIATDPRDIERILSRSDAGLNTLIDLSVAGGSDGAERVVIVRELQRDPVRGDLLHADFVEVDLSQTIEVSVPIHLSGTAKGVAVEGGILDHTLRELEIECLPRAIPDEITLDVSKLSIGDSIHVSEIALPEGVELRSDPSLSVVSVVAARVAEAEEAEAEAVEAPEAVAEAVAEAAAEKPAGEEKPEGGE